MQSTLPFGYPYPAYILGLSSLFDTRREDMKDTKSNYQQWQDTYGKSAQKPTKGSTTLGADLARDDSSTFGSRQSPTGKTNTSRGPSLSGYTADRVNEVAKQSLADFGLSAAKSLGLTSAVGLAAGISPSAVANAAIGSAAQGVFGALPGMVGKMAATSFGMEPTKLSTITDVAIPTALGVALGPIGGIIGGLVAPSTSGLMADAFGMRNMEHVRDMMEDTIGPLSGRRAGAEFADALDKTKDVRASFNQAINSMNVPDLDKSLAQRSFSSALGSAYSSPVTDQLGKTAADIAASPAAAYAGAMMGLGDLGFATDPTGMSKSAFGDISTVGVDTFNDAMSSFAGPASSAIGGVTAEQAAQNTAASVSAAAAAAQAAEASVADTATADTSTDTSTDDADTADTSADTEGDTEGEASGTDGEGASGGDGGGSADGLGSEGGGSADNEGGPNGGSDSQGTGEGQAGDGTGSGAEGQNDSGDDGSGW